MVVSHKIGTARSGTRSVDVRFMVEDGEGWEIVGNIWLTDKAWEMARKSLKAIGFDVDKQSTKLLDTNKELLAGNKCNITVAEEEYKGKTSLKVKFINPLSEAPSEDIFAKWDKKLREAKKKPDETTGEVEDASVPF